MPEEIFDLQEIKKNAAAIICKADYITERNKLGLIKMLGEMNEPLSNQDTCKLTILGEQLKNYVNPTGATTALMLSAHFTLGLSPEESTPNYIIFYAKPIIEEDKHFDLAYHFNVRDALLSLGKKSILVFGFSGFGRVKISWYDPFSETISVKFVDDDGGYSVMSLTDMIIGFGAAKRLGYVK